MLELNYKEYGQGEPIIILHGLFGTLDNWQTIAKHLSENYAIYLIDQRNHGRSPHVEGLDYQLLAEDLYNFMQSHWIHKAHIIGHSMGGKTVMQFAMNYPDMIATLTVIDIAPKEYKGGHEVIIEALQEVNLAQVTDRKEVDNQLAVKIPDFGQRQFLMKNLSRNEETNRLEWKMNLTEIVRCYPNILKNIESNERFDEQTLFIRGENSDYIKDDDIASLDRYFSDYQLVTIPNAGHWVHAEQPKLLLEAISSFLKN